MSTPETRFVIAQAEQVPMGAVSIGTENQYGEYHPVLEEEAGLALDFMGMPIVRALSQQGERVVLVSNPTDILNGELNHIMRPPEEESEDE